MEFPTDMEQRRKILARYHDHPTAGHPGIDKMKALVKCHFEGEGINKFTEAYVQGCAICQENKVQIRQKKALLYTMEVKPIEGPFQNVLMDLITDLP